MKPQRYDSYKHSGIDWLGDIPTHWEVSRTKFFHKNLKKINTNRISENVLSLTLRGVVNNNLDSPEGLVPKDYATYQIFEKDDLVFKLIDLENISTSRVGIVHEKGIMSSAYIRLKIGEDNFPRFAYYYYYSLYVNQVYNNIGSGVRSTLTATDLLNIEYVLPPLEEQKQIADYLDKKINKIDEAIKIREKTAKSLKEYRQALINETVTKGLDKSIPLKHSGIDWLGDIPTHWEVKKLKYNSKIETGNSISDDKKNNYENITYESYPYIATKDINYEFSTIDYNNGLRIPAFEKHFKIANPNTTLICVEGGSAGKKIAYNIQKICYVNKLASIENNPDNAPKFLYYLTKSQVFQNHFESSINGLIGGVSISIMKNFELIFPPLEEQKQIADYLDKKINKIDEAIELQNNYITKLKEYKNTLIDSAVTGKIRITSKEYR